MVVVGNSVTRVTHLVQTQNLRGFSLEKKKIMLYENIKFLYFLISWEGIKKKKFSKGKKFLLLAGKK